MSGAGEDVPAEKESSSMWSKIGATSRSMKDSGVESIKNSEVKVVLRHIHVISVISALATIAIGVYGFTVLPDCDGCWKASFAVVELYTVMAGVFMLFIEVLQNYCFSKKVNFKLYRNFGFVYTYRGKALFLFFMATLCWSSISNSWGAWFVNIIIGAFVFLAAVFVVTAYYVNPKLKKVEMKPIVVTKPSKMTSENTIQENTIKPDTAQQDVKQETPPEIGQTTSPTEEKSNVDDVRLNVDEQTAANEEQERAEENTADVKKQEDSAASVIGRWWRGNKTKK